MNKNDIRLIGLCLIVAVSSLLLLKTFSDQSGAKTAFVYYRNDLLLNIDLTQPKPKLYTVKGNNGDVVIEYSDGKVRVNLENSPKHLCSKQGWIEKSYETIVCLPNEIIIKIENNSDIDTVVK